MPKLGMFIFHVYTAIPHIQPLEFYVVKTLFLNFNCFAACLDRPCNLGVLLSWGILPNKTKNWNTNRSTYCWLFPCRSFELSNSTQVEFCSDFSLKFSLKKLGVSFSINLKVTVFQIKVMSKDISVFIKMNKKISIKSKCWRYLVI